MSGHGHVTPNADGSKARCGGPGICPECSTEWAQHVGAHVKPTQHALIAELARLREENKRLDAALQLVCGAHDELRTRLEAAERVVEAVKAADAAITWCCYEDCVCPAHALSAELAAYDATRAPEGT
jgi:hypothetical protein